MIRSQTSTRSVRPRRSRRGAILILMCVAMVILLVAAAFTVDIAYMHLTRQELHIACDAAAKAAVAKLSLGGTQAQAKAAAVTCAAANTVGGAPLNIDTASVTLGGVTYSQNSRWAFTAGATPITSAKVNVSMTEGSTPGPIRLLFGRTLGTSIFTPTNSSTAAFVRNKVCLTLDRSHSMCFDLSGTDWRYPPAAPSNDDDAYVYHPVTGSRWYSLSTAINTFLDVIITAPVETRVALVTWGSNITYTYKKVRYTFPATARDSTFVTSYAPLRTAITNRGNTTMLGGTNMSAGMDDAIDLFADTDDGTPWNKIMILFSDGEWNQGSNPVTTAQSAVSAGIVIHTVGLLSGGNTALQDIAAATGGRYFYAPNAAALQTAFEEIARTLPIILTE